MVFAPPCADSCASSIGAPSLTETELHYFAGGGVRDSAAAAIDVPTLLLHTGREWSTAAVSSGHKITAAEAVRARRDMVYAQHQVAWALDRLCEMDGARWADDSDALGAIRRDVMTILTHYAASRQARNGALRQDAPHPRSGVSLAEIAATLAISGARTAGEGPQP